MAKKVPAMQAQGILPVASEQGRYRTNRGHQEFISLPPAPKGPETR